MIGYLRGVARGPRVIDVAGVGYLVNCPEPMRTGENVELHVVTVVREDAINLYGFTNEDDRVVFDALTKVTGVGPSIALALLAGLGAAGIVDAVRRKDPKGLGGVKGVGVKVAEKIVTLCKLPDGLGGSVKEQELVRAVVGLGFDKNVAQHAVKQAFEQLGDDAEESVLLTTAINEAKKVNQ
jgi:Holliday junction DNA helicase RuvA